MDLSSASEMDHKFCFEAGFIATSSIEEQIGQHAHYHHQDERYEIAVRPFKLRYAFEIHSIDRGDQRRWHQRPPDKKGTAAGHPTQRSPYDRPKQGTYPSVRRLAWVGWYA